MFTLTKASKETKTILKWLLIILVVIFCVFIVYKLAVMVKDTLYPTPPPQPTLLYGKISAPNFPQNSINQKLTYSIDTVSGFLPEFSDQIKVYTIFKPKPDLIALQKAGEKVRSGGFTNGPFKVSDTIYDWSTNNEDLQKNIRVNIDTFDFQVTSNLFYDPNVLSADNLSDQTEAISIAKNFLEKMGYLSDNLDIVNTEVNMFSISNNSFIPATSLSNAQTMQVNFFQNSIDDLPIYYQKPNESNINILIAGGNSSAQIVGANYLNQKVTDESSTYPIKTIDQAFEDLKNGKAYLASFDGQGSEIKIKDVFLAYYMEPTAQNYLTPIFIFKGNDGFQAYVTAIKDELINK